MDLAELLDMFIDDLGFYILAVIDLLKEYVGGFYF